MGTGMDTGKEIRDFLMSRRAKISPEEVGLPAVGRRLLASWVATEQPHPPRGPGARAPLDGARRLRGGAGQAHAGGES